MLNTKFFERAMRRYGRSVTVYINGMPYRKKGIVTNSGRDFMRKYDDDHLKRDVLGHTRRRDKILYLPWFVAWDTAESDIVVDFLDGRKYIVVADSVLRLGDDPLYIWALISEENAVTDKYYEELGNGD